MIFAEASWQYRDANIMPGGWVARNRVTSRQFPSTYFGAISQHNQFRSYQSKLWNLSDDPLALKGRNFPAFIKAINVALGVIGGTIGDPTHGAVYFNSFKTQTGWFKTNLEEGVIYPDNEAR